MGQRAAHRAAARLQPGSASNAACEPPAMRRPRAPASAGPRQRSWLPSPPAPPPAAAPRWGPRGSALQQRAARVARRPLRQQGTVASRSRARRAAAGRRTCVVHKHVDAARHLQHRRHRSIHRLLQPAQGGRRRGRLSRASAVGTRVSDRPRMLLALGPTRLVSHVQLHRVHARRLQLRQRREAARRRKHAVAPPAAAAAGTLGVQPLSQGAAQAAAATGDLQGGHVGVLRGALGGTRGWLVASARRSSGRDLPGLAALSRELTSTTCAIPGGLGGSDADPCCRWRGRRGGGSAEGSAEHSAAGVDKDFRGGAGRC